MASVSTRLAHRATAAKPLPVSEFVRFDTGQNDKSEGDEPLDAFGDDAPSDDELPEASEFALAVSISRAQTYIANPKTPAVEKDAALKASGGYFGDFWDLPSEPIDEEDSEVQESERDHSTTPNEINKVLLDLAGPELLSLPSPWTAGPKTFQITEPAPAAPLKSRRPAQTQRRRSSSGPELRTYNPFSSKSLARTSKFLSDRFSDSQQHKGLKSGDSESSLSDASARSAEGRLITVNQSHDRIHGQSIASTDGAVYKFSHQNPPKPPCAEKDHIAKSAPEKGPDGFKRLERTKSTISTASSLGDDSRFSHITKQVNNRSKAVMDSFQDTSLKIPSISGLPLPSLSFWTQNSSKSDLSESAEPKQSRASRSTLRESLSSSFRLSPSPSRRARATSLQRPAESKKASVAQSVSPDGQSQSHFARALEHLSGDVVILGGYRGSVLKDARNPDRRLWIPFKAGLNLQKVDLELGTDPADEETEHERVVAPKTLSHIGPVDISRRLLKRLRVAENDASGSLRIHDWGYDWRLSPHRLSQQLIQFLEKLPCNMEGGARGAGSGATVIAHSLGGLITRHAVNQRPELFSGVLFAGVPQHCVNILGPMRNGDDVLFSQNILTAQVNFTIRTSFALLPLSGRCFVDKNTKEEYPVDFFNARDWVENCLSPCVSDLPTPIANTSDSHTSILPSLRQKLPDFTFLNRKEPQPQKGELATGESMAEAGAEKSGMGMSMSGNRRPSTEDLEAQAKSGKTAVSMSRERALEYLTRTLAECKQFLQELAFEPSQAHSNRYPPLAVMYGKSVPTVCGAKVDGRDGIGRAAAYDELAFASGDGVVLARAAQLPEGYKAAKGGVVSTNRGHVTLLTDHEAVGRCLNALMRARSAGVGLGRERVHLDRAASHQ